MSATAGNGRIVVGVDGSASSIDALRHAARLSAALGQSLDVVTTWAPPIADAYIYHGDWRPEDDARSLQKEAIADAFGDTPPAELRARVIAGPAASTLIDESKSADMLVLGSRGHGGFIGLLLGSVSATCAQHADCPVLIVRSPMSEGSAESEAQTVG